MNITLNKYSFTIVLFFILLNCGDEKNTKNETDNSNENEKFDLSNKGIGPIKSVNLSEKIDPKMVAKGMEIYNTKCSACHKIDKKYIGAPLKGILKRRSPEWVMNMILNPEEMLTKDTIGKQLLIEYMGAPMAIQNLNEKDARYILEYLRTLD